MPSPLPHRPGLSRALQRRRFVECLPHLVACAMLVAMLAAVALPLGALAHPGDGIDAGMARMSAKSQGSETRVSIEVLNPRPCPGFEAQAVLAARAELTVSGGLQLDGECRFSGTLQLPEQGKWTVTFSMLIDGQRSQLALPISVTDEEQVFLREDWLHIDAAAITAPKQSTLERMQSAIPGGVASLGVALGVVALGVWAWRSRRDGPAAAP